MGTHDHLRGGALRPFFGTGSLRPALFRAACAAAAITAASLAWARPAAAAEPTRLTVQLDWVLNAQYAGILVAREMGYYSDAGLAVKVESIDPNVMDPIGPIVAQPGIVGFADGFRLLTARRDGKPVKAFATTLQASPLGLFTLERSGITTVAQLAGKTIGVQSYDHRHLEVLLRFNGVDPATVRMKDIGDDTTSLPSGLIDAQLGYLVDERIALEQKGFRLNLMPGFANGFVCYSEVYFTRDDTFAANPKVLEAFLEATNRGWHEAFLHPSDTARLIVRRSMPAASVDYQERSLSVIQSFVTHESDQFGMMRHETWRQSADLFHIDPAVTDALVDYSILNEVYGKLR